MLQSIGFDWQVALANLINFLVIVWIIKKFLWKPIQSKISERQHVITEGLENARKAEKNLQESEEQSAEIIADARSEAQSLVASAYDERKDILDTAKQDAESTKKQLTIEVEGFIERYKEEEMKVFKEEASTLFRDIAEKVLQEELTEEAKKAYASKAAARL